MDAIHLPSALTLPTAFGASGSAVPPGQLIQALVLELIESDVFRLQLPQAVVDVRASIPLVPGSTITLATQGAGPNAKLVIYADPATPVAGQGVPQAARIPIGEAVVIARAPTGPKPALPTVRRDLTPVGAARAPVPAPNPTAARETAPAQALGETVRAAALRQSGLAPLFADLEQVASAPPGALPAPVQAAAAQVLALRVPLGEDLTGGDIRQAFVRSGVLLEPRLAATTPQPAAQPSQPATRLATSTGPAGRQVASAPIPADDLKAALLVLRQLLRAALDDAPPPAKAATAAPATPAPTGPDHPETVRPTLALSDSASIRHLAAAFARAPVQPSAASPLSPAQAATLAKTLAAVLATHDASAQPMPAGPNGGPPPPYRGAPLAAQPPVVPAIAPDAAPQDIAEHLLADTDGALARTTLLQAASLPDQPGGPRLDPTAQRWTFEVPFASPQGTAIAQFEVSRDGHGAQTDRPLPVWRARFSLDVEPIGPVHALIALAGERTSVTLWAERPATASRLSAQAPLLSDALRAAELEPADFQFRLGSPPVAAKAATPGRFMDRAS